MGGGGGGGWGEAVGRSQGVVLRFENNQAKTEFLSSLILVIEDRGATMKLFSIPFYGSK